MATLGVLSPLNCIRSFGDGSCLESTPDPFVVRPTPLLSAYNFCRFHSTIKTTPAVAAGLTDHVWSVKELLEMAAA